MAGRIGSWWVKDGIDGRRIDPDGTSPVDARTAIG